MNSIFIKKITATFCLSVIILSLNAQQSSIPTPDKLTGFYFLDMNSGYVIADNNLFMTTDRGQNWVKIIAEGDAYKTPPKTGSKLLTMPYGCYLKDVFFLDQMTGWVSIIGLGGGVYRTTDGGKSWNPQAGYDNFKELHNYYHSLFFLDAKNGFGCAPNNGHSEYQTFDRTVDGGIHYTPVDFPWKGTSILIGKGFSDIYFLNSQIGWIAGDAGIMRTADGGKTWTIDSTAVYDVDYYYGGKKDYFDVAKRIPAFESICFKDANNGIAVAGYEIFMTGNGGKSWYGWEDSTMTITGLTDGILLDEMTGLAAGGTYPSKNNQAVPEGFLLKTTDGGQKWESIMQSDYPYGPFQLLKTGNILAGSRKEILILK